MEYICVSIVFFRAVNWRCSCGTHWISMVNNNTAYEEF